MEKKILELKKNAKQLLNHERSTHGLCHSLRKLLKEVALFENHINSVKNFKNNKEILTTTKIQLGGGSHKLKGYLNIDVFPPADFIWDVREGLPFEDSCSDFIFFEHFLEHIDYPASAKKIIGECFRVLKMGGKIVIGVPDSEKMITNYFYRNNGFYEKLIKNWYSKRNFLTDINTYIDLLNYHFRDQDNDEKYNPHFWAYDYEKLQSVLKEKGFSEIKKWSFDEKIANPKRKFGSLYVIAKK